MKFVFVTGYVKKSQTNFMRGKWKLRGSRDSTARSLARSINK